MAAGGGRNLVVLSDGTGNSAAKPFKTNVWRLYEALKLTDGTQVAEFGDGVGTSSVTFLRVIGLAFGWGVKRNVLNLYKFLCHNHQPNDRIWAFGFSRGAFTIRVLVGLIDTEGLVCFETEDELERNAIAAYRAYRAKRFHTRLPWVRAGRALRDRTLAGWHWLTGVDPRRRQTRGSVPIRFVGVWDTVVAYGLPINELTDAVDKWIWPMKFRDCRLSSNVEFGRQALSLDDERTTFHPVTWRGTMSAASDLRQVWFAGSHADVGGGYPDDGLSYVALNWMIDEAASKGLAFEPAVVDAFRSLVAPTGRIYDSRAGFGVFWRYDPRNASLLLDGATPVVDGSVMMRMAHGNDGYAPISLPEAIEVLPPAGPPLAFAVASLDAARQELAAHPLTPAALNDAQGRFLEAARILAEAASRKPNRADLVSLVQDTVWWRRVVYFVSLALVLTLAAAPLLSTPIKGIPDALNDLPGTAIRWTLKLLAGFLPAYAGPWVEATMQNPVPILALVLALVASLALSGVLRARICDRARAAWNVSLPVCGRTIDRLRPTGQARGWMTATVAFLVFAIVAYRPDDQVSGLSIASVVSGLLALACLSFWSIRRFEPMARMAHVGVPRAIDPARPGRLLAFARAARTNGQAVSAYRFMARTIGPFCFILLSVIVVFSLAHHLAFNTMSSMGYVCGSAPHDLAAAAKGDQEIVGPDQATFNTNELCHATGLRLVKGRNYRITIAMGSGVQGAWFDKGSRTDVAGFPTASGGRADVGRHLIASPLKRWWRADWFQPIARIGAAGNYEQVLQPAAPLTVVDFAPCRPDDDGKWTKDIPSPAPDDYKQRQLACEAEKKIAPNRVLFSDITADETGELFIYVNDAALLFPGWVGRFYKNNSGTARVTVTRIPAPALVPAPEN
jgi:uncharacterized protein (DUF2235 family)